MKTSVTRIGGVGMGLVFVLWSLPALAQTDPHLMQTGIGGCNFATGVMTFQCIPNYVGFLVKTVFGFIGTICLVQILYAGYLKATASLPGGDGEAWKKKLRDALIGLAFCIIAFALVDLIVGYAISPP